MTVNVHCRVVKMLVVHTDPLVNKPKLLLLLTMGWYILVIRVAMEEGELNVLHGYICAPQIFVWYICMCLKQ